MSGTEGGGGGRKILLSTHRCPEVDLLPYYDSEAQIPPLRSLAPAEKNCEFTCTNQSEAKYLDISSTRGSEEEGNEEEEEGSASDWSEEDLFLHFSPSVILTSEEEESETESNFKCVDITMETKVSGHEGEGLKMVPKRQIQLRKRKDIDLISKERKNEKLQVILKNESAELLGANSEVSGIELFCPTVRHRPDVLLRQHSMPSSFHTPLTNSGDVYSYKVYKELVAGASQGFPAGGNRLLKSFSLDETKTKLASCIIKSVLSKKMQVEQSSTNNPHLKKKSDSPTPENQQELGEGEGGVKGPVHVVRDMRSLVKNTHKLRFPTATTPENHKPTFDVIGEDGSPPCSYQWAVKLKGHHKTDSPSGHVKKLAEFHSQSHDMKHSNPQQGKDGKPIPRRRLDDVTSPVNQSESMRYLQAGASPPPQCSSIPRGPSLCSQPQSSCPSCVEPIRLPPAPPSPSSMCLPILHPYPGGVSYCPLSSTQIQLQPPLPAPSLHQRRSEENRSTQDQPDCYMSLPLPHETRTTGDHNGHSSMVTLTTQTMQQLPFLCQGFLPAQVGGDFLVDICSSAVAPGAALRGSNPCDLMFQQHYGRGLCVASPPQLQKKMLLDPETGQFIQVFFPTASVGPNTAAVNSAPPMLQMGTNPAPSAKTPVSATTWVSTGCSPLMLHMGISSTPVVITPPHPLLQMGTTHFTSVMKLQPTVAFPSQYGPLPSSSPCIHHLVTSHTQHHDSQCDDITL
ncbi:uncharacterized protein LOC115054715 [Echeneis naucrates]|uniref:uncharacterized protein LOC115054715 n=1 Tax=Echeneis naucrates TaxID=173247 RepID=UPI001113D091|nr:uncharacterized protein LOC115054715 [Echeneis naucrates]